MKATVFTTLYNKESCLENTIFSLFLQVTNFDWELRIYDDCSNENQKSVVRKYFPTAFYRRLKVHRPFDEMMTYCLDGESDIVVMMSADVILTTPEVLQTVVDATKPGFQAYATVFNADVPPDMYKDFDAGVKTIWDGAMRHIPIVRTGAFTRPYFFFGGITREDLERVQGNVTWCDIRLNQRMAEAGYKPVFPKKCFGVHQNHSTTTLPCSRIIEGGVGNCDIEPCQLKGRIRRGLHSGATGGSRDKDSRPEHEKVFDGVAVG